MKTPREILFERHQRMEPKLDLIRQQALAELANAPERTGRKEPPSAGAILRTVWLELVWPCRRAWAGLALVWLAVAAANVTMQARFHAAPVARSAAPAHLAQALEEQRRLLAELLPPTATVPAVKRAEPGRQPRSERRVSFKAC